MVDISGMTSDRDRAMARVDAQAPEYFNRRSDFMSDLSDAVRDNPLPAAMIGMGILWMFAGGGKTSLADAMTGRGTRSMARSLVRGAESVGESMLHGAGKIGSTVAGAAHGTMDTLTGAAGQVGHALMPSSRHDMAHDMASDYDSADRGVMGNVPARISDAASSMQSGLQQSLSDLFERRPLVLGAAGLALGAGIAASLPVTGAEKQVMGKASDYVHNKVSEVTGQVKDMAAAAAQEAEAHGLSTKTVRDTLTDIAGQTTSRL